MGRTTNKGRFLLKNNGRQPKKVKTFSNPFNFVSNSYNPSFLTSSLYQKPASTLEIIDSPRPSDLLPLSLLPPLSSLPPLLPPPSSLHPSSSSSNPSSFPPPPFSSHLPSNKVGFKDFEGIRVLGAGSFGKVFLVRRRRDGGVFAMKMLKKRDLIIKKQLRYAVTEANVLKKCRHPFILALHHAFQV